MAYLAPIDIDPNHAMGDPRSPEREDYRGALLGWERAMQGRVIIYDYDQGMLNWRDLPDPSQQVLQQDIQEYRRAGILGFGTESRNAIATTFLNLHFRGQLYWNPDCPVDAELSQFYLNFFGPLAAPMASYWNAIFQAWKDTAVTEHEVFAAPAIYTPELVARLGLSLGQAESAFIAAGKPQPWAERLRFVRLSYGILKGYVEMTRLAASQCDYAQAARVGAEALAVREQLTDMNGTFTTYRNYPEQGPGFWPGEVALMRELASLSAGLITKLPLEWQFNADVHDEGLWRGWASQPPADGRPMRTDLYCQAQGLKTADHHSLTGFGWYRSPVILSASQLTRPVHLCFPGLFNESWLYLNGVLVAHREQKPLWWQNDYSFRWDVDLGRRLRPGVNQLVLRTVMSHQLSGMFRRPFLYAAAT